MKSCYYTKHLTVTAAFLLAQAAFGQTDPTSIDSPRGKHAPAFTLRLIAGPQTVIDGKNLGECPIVDSSAVGDSGKAAFVLYCDDHYRLFTVDHLIVGVGDQVDGKIIAAFHKILAVNSRGQVLYEAFFSDVPNDQPEGWRFGLFLDRYFVAIVPDSVADQPYRYRLTDDGAVAADIMPLAANDGLSKRCPGNSPNLRPELAGILFTVAGNHCGPYLLNIDTPASRPLLLLAIPIKK